MSYVRVVMADAKTPENLAKIIEQLNKANEIFPEIQMMMAIETSETTGLSISVYQDKAAAIRGVKLRELHFEELGAELEVSFEGTLAAYYKKDPVIAGLS